MNRSWQRYCGLVFLLACTQAYSEPRVVGVIGGGNLQCFDNASLGGRPTEVTPGQLQDHCATANRDDCMDHAEEMFLEYSFDVAEQTKETLRLDLDGKRVCWVAKAGVKGTGLRVANLKKHGTTVVCDPQGGMGASACEREN